MTGRQTTKNIVPEPKRDAGIMDKAVYALRSIIVDLVISLNSKG